MIWDLYQQMRIRDVQEFTRRAKDDTAMLVRKLRRSVDSLTLTCAAMWELQRDQSGSADKALIEKMQEIDLRDGKLDGKMTKPATACPSCQRANNAKSSKSVYRHSPGVPPGAENRDAVKAVGLDYSLNPGEGAFYVTEEL